MNRESRLDHGAGMLVVAWETTRKCPLKCTHCRASATAEGADGDLSTDEARLLIDSITRVSAGLLILTGGEPMSRPDIYEIAQYAVNKGFRVVMSPCGTMVDDDSAKCIAASGISRVSLSIDGDNAAFHDSFRGVAGAFDTVMAAAATLRNHGIEFQINSTIMKDNYNCIEKLYDLATAIGAVAFSPFLLVPTGRASSLAGSELSASEYEVALKRIYLLARGGGIFVRPTCAPHYYRVVAESREDKEGNPSGHGVSGCIGGRGFVFVSHRAELGICGFLDVPCGNLRENGFDFEALYSSNPVFDAVRDRSRYTGKCGVCEYFARCGGCRARAYAASGDWLGDEPYCSYIPHAMRMET